MNKILMVAMLAAAFAAPNAYAGKMNESGFNLGVNAGWLHGKSTQKVTDWEGDSDYDGLKVRESDNAGLIGIQLGYRHVKNDFMIGVEGDYQFTNIKNNNTGAPYYPGVPFYDSEYASANIGEDVDRFATLRLKAGYVVNPETMVYVTGGYAYTKGDVKLYDGDGNVGHSGKDKVGADGWTAGFGVERSITDNISIKGEYLYLRTHANAHTYNPDEDEDYYAKNTFKANLLRVGVNYNF